MVEIVQDDHSSPEVWQSEGEDRLSRTGLTRQTSPD